VLPGTVVTGTPTRSVYAATLPDGMDLMARWAPIAQASALLAIVKDLMTPGADARARRMEAFPGLVESIMHQMQR
jgi:hypothetical protein